MKSAEKIRAISLRKRGLSYRKIQNKINISKGTLSMWLRNIPLTKSQKETLFKNKRYGGYKGAKKQQLKRIKKTEQLIKAGQNEFLELFKNPLFLSGLLLYWAEGDKHQKEMVRFTNSDPAMIMLMMQWFRRVCKVQNDKFRIALHIHNLHMADNVKDYWAKITDIPLNQFYKMYIKKSSLRYKRNILYNGTCKIIVNNKDLFRKIAGWKLGLLKYFKISTPRSSMDRTRDF